MDNSSGADRQPNQPVNFLDRHANLNIQELTDRLRQSFEREYEERNRRRRHRSRSQIPDQPSQQNVLNQQQVNGIEQFFRHLPPSPALQFQQHSNSTGRLLILAIIIAKEDNPEGTSTQIWEAFAYKLQTTPIFNSEEQVIQAWQYVFRAPHRPMFDTLVSGSIDQVYHKVSQLELPYPFASSGY